MRVSLYRVGRNLNRAVRLCEAFGVGRLELVDCDGARVEGNLYSAAGRVEVVQAEAVPDLPTTVALDLPGRGVVPIETVDWSGVECLCCGGETAGLPRLEQAQRAYLRMFGEQHELTVEAALAIGLWQWRSCENGTSSAGRGNRRRDVAIDLDETLMQRPSTYRKGEFGPPVEGVESVIHALRTRGYRVIVHTARGQEEREAIADHLAMFGITVDGIVCGKPRALAYIDDRAIRFGGDWERTLEELEAALGDNALPARGVSG